MTVMGIFTAFMTLCLIAGIILAAAILYKPEKRPSAKR